MSKKPEGREVLSYGMKVYIYCERHTYSMEHNLTDEQYKKIVRYIFLGEELK